MLDGSKLHFSRRCISGKHMQMYLASYPPTLDMHIKAAMSGISEVTRQGRSSNEQRADLRKEVADSARVSASSWIESKTVLW